MATQSRKQTREMLLQSIEDNKHWREIYLASPHQQQDFQRFSDWQLNYFLSFASDEIESGEYQQAMQFVMQEMAGAHVIERDRQLERVVPTMARLLPERLLRALAEATRYNADLLRINIGIWQAMQLDGRLPESIEINAYHRAAQKVTSWRESRTLVQTCLRLGQTVRSAVNNRWVARLLSAMSGPARAAGLHELQQMLDNGFRTFQELPDSKQFLDDLDDTMNRALNTIFDRR